MTNIDSELNLARQSGEIYRQDERRRVTKGENPWPNYGRRYPVYGMKFRHVLSLNEWLGKNTPSSVLEVCGPIDFVKSLIPQGLRFGMAITLNDFRPPNQKAGDHDLGLSLLEANIWDSEIDWVEMAKNVASLRGFDGFDLSVLNPIGGLIIETNIPGRGTISPSPDLEHLLLNQMWSLANPNKATILAELCFQDKQEIWTNRLRASGLTVSHYHSLYCIQGCRSSVPNLPKIQ